MERFYSSVAFVVLSVLLLVAVLRYEPQVRFEAIEFPSKPLAAPD